MAIHVDPTARTALPARADERSLPINDGGVLGYGLTALLVAAAFLFSMLAKSGIWDPHELDRAELGRRIAVALFGARPLSLEGDPTGLPTLSDLGMGELPFTSMALGFRWLGLHDYAGRLPLALWGLAGGAATWLFVRRLVGPRPALYAVVALVTMPLYFMQARTMLGDIVTMASFAACFGGFAGAMLAPAPSSRARFALATALWLLLGLGGALGGYLSRGLLVGVAAPLAGVGLGWLCLMLAADRTDAPRSVRVRAHAVGAVALLAAAACIVVGASLLYDKGAPSAPLRRALGFAVAASPSTESTFDWVVRELGHGLFPWSAFLPFALARLLRAPAGTDERRDHGEIGLRVLLVTGAASAYGVHAWIAPHAAPVPFAGVALLAAIAAIAIHDVERGAEPAPAVGVGTAVLCLVLWADIAEMPLKALSVFAVEERSFPKEFEGAARQIMLAAALVFALVVLLAWLERGLEASTDRVGQWLRRRARVYGRAIADFARLWRGNTLFGLLLVEASLIGLAGMLRVGRGLGWPAVAKLSYNVAFVALNAWWALLVLPVLGLVALELARFLFGLLLRWLRLPRASSTVIAALVAGGLLSFGYYPALAARLSPREVFVRYAALHAPGEPLAVVGLAPRSVRYYAGGEHVEPIANAKQAHGWLTEPAEPGRPTRRWVVLRSKDLPELNALFRQSERRNLPIVDASSGTILLGSNELGGMPNRNWLEAYVLAEPPAIQHPVTATLESGLDALGWDIVDSRGRLVDAVVPGRDYRMRFYYRVLERTTRNYKAFIHIDGQGRRHNGDHDLVRGQLPLNLWQPGDVMVDDYTLVLEPNFTPGAYHVYYGFFQGNARMHVTAGSAQDDRIDGGLLQVR